MKKISLEQLVSYLPTKFKTISKRKKPNSSLYYITDNPFKSRVTGAFRGFLQIFYPVKRNMQSNKIAIFLFFILFLLSSSNPIS